MFYILRRHDSLPYEQLYINDDSFGKDLSSALTL